MNYELYKRINLTLNSDIGIQLVGLQNITLEHSGSIENVSEGLRPST